MKRAVESRAGNAFQSNAEGADDGENCRAPLPTHCIAKRRYSPLKTRATAPRLVL